MEIGVYSGKERRQAGRWLAVSQSEPSDDYVDASTQRHCGRRPAVDRAATSIDRRPGDQRRTGRPRPSRRTDDAPAADHSGSPARSTHRRRIRVLLPCRPQLSLSLVQHPGFSSHSAFTAAVRRLNAGPAALATARRLFGPWEPRLISFKVIVTSRYRSNRTCRPGVWNCNDIMPRFVWTL